MANLHLPKRKLFTSLAVALLVSMLITSIGFAHANQIRSNPADGAILEESPKEIMMWFDEPVSSRFSSVQLFDINSNPIEIIEIHGDPTDPTLLVVSIPELPSGVYSLLWKALSDVDGHFSQGLLVFGVGEDADLGAATIAPVEDQPPALPEVSIRWLNLLVLSGLIGPLAVIQLVVRPIKSEAKSIRDSFYSVFSKISNRLLRFAVWCVFGAGVVGIAQLLWQSVSVTEGTGQQSGFIQMLGQTIFQTRWGITWMAHQLFLLLAGSGIIFIYQKEKNGYDEKEKNTVQAAWVLVLIFSLGLVILQALSSHAAGLTIGSTSLAVVSHGLHLLGAILWMGGLMALAVGLLPLLREHREDIGYLVRFGWRRFSTLVGGSLMILIATGFYNTSRQVASIDALLTTVYGQALLVKIGLLVGFFYLGFHNLLLLHTSLSSSLSKSLRKSNRWTPYKMKKLPTLVFANVAFGVLILLATGVITSSASPRDTSFTIDLEMVPNSLSQSVDDFVVTLSTKPNRPGQNVFTVFVGSTRRPLPEEVAKVILRFNYLDQDIGRESVTLEEVEPGRFLLGGSYLKLPGNWTVDVVIRRQGMEDSVAHFNWVVAPPGEARPEVVSKAPLASPLTIAAVVTLVSIPLHMLVVLWVKHRDANRKPAHEGRTKTVRVKASQ